VKTPGEIIWRAIEDFTLFTLRSGAVIPADLRGMIPDGMTYSTAKENNMKDLSKWTDDCEVRDVVEGEEWVDLCIKKLLADRQHKLTDEVVHGLTFEELFRALAAGKAAMIALNEADEEQFGY